ncbi:hypothetical protein MTR_3g032400 [Medicago truncatula]|uniref:Uncharacterized protein n=1 Tax=Medicago truncatula TaxID=3880 RepID=G7IX07_MEDTR|nr:hypothetical protein MTR_3g032400 [Medicago truncatula]
MDKRIKKRINGELLYLTGDWFHSSTTMNNTLSRMVKKVARKTHMEHVIVMILPVKMFERNEMVVIATREDLLSLLDLYLKK